MLWQHPTRHQLYGHLPPITKTIQVKWTRHAGHCWRSKDELISDVLLWTLTYGWAKAGRPVWTYILQLCEDMGCSPEDLPEAMNDRKKWLERVRDIRASGRTWWWWWQLPCDLQQFFFIGYAYAHVSLLCFPLVTVYVACFPLAICPALLTVCFLIATSMGKRICHHLLSSTMSIRQGDLPIITLLILSSAGWSCQQHSSIQQHLQDMVTFQ